VPSKTHYEVLQVGRAAPADEIKRAFREQIARYHPDKVQHLGTEFQELAAGRAAALTEAYRVLSNELQRAEYDRSLAACVPAKTAAAASPAAVRDPAPAPAPPPPQAEAPQVRSYTKEHASRDRFVRKATLEKVRQAIALVGGDYDEKDVRGFDIALAPKPKFFGGGKRPRLLGRVINPVDATAVADAWSQATKWTASPKDETCVLLLGSPVASARELADAIAAERRKSRGAKLTLIPIDSRSWDAHVPVDAPAICRDLLARLQSGK
jgi:curved DNA-binding protein CbpA